MVGAEIIAHLEMKVFSTHWERLWRDYLIFRVPAGLENPFKSGDFICKNITPKSICMPQLLGRSWIKWSICESLKFHRATLWRSVKSLWICVITLFFLLNRELRSCLKPSTNCTLSLPKERLHSTTGWRAPWRTCRTPLSSTPSKKSRWALIGKNRGDFIHLYSPRAVSSINSYFASSSTSSFSLLKLAC